MRPLPISLAGVLNQRLVERLFCNFGKNSDVKAWIQFCAVLKGFFF